MEERFAIDFLRDRIVDNVSGHHAVVVGLNPGVDPERLDAYDLLLLIAHRTRYIHHVKDQGIAFRTLLGLPGEVTFVFVDRDNVGIQWIVRARRNLPLQRFFIGAFEMAKRFGSDFGDLRIVIAFGLQARAAFGLDTRKLELFGEDLRQFFHGEIHFQDVRAGRVTGLAVAVFVHIAGCERSSRLAFTLADTARVTAAEAEVGHFDLRDRNADEILPLLSDQLSLRYIFLQVLLDLAPDDLPESKIILLDV